MTSPSTGELFAEALSSQHYLAAQQRVLRQLIEALLFERVLRAETTQEHGGVCFHIPGRTAAGQLVAYRCNGRISESFGRIRLDGGSIMRSAPEGERPVASLQEFVLEAGALIDTDESLLHRFLHELQQTLQKDTLARYTRWQGGEGRDLTALEGQLQDAHPYHPCYKSRVGFDPLDNAAYGPEFAPSVHLSWRALRRAKANVAACRDIDLAAFLRSEVGEEQYAQFSDRLTAMGLEPDDYWLLPAHPWHWREKIASQLFPLLHSRDLVWLGEGSDAYRPLQSIRSLANTTRTGRPRQTADWHRQHLG